MMQEAQKRYNQELAASNKWIKENTDFLAERANKRKGAMDAVKAETEAQIKLRGEWEKTHRELEKEINTASMTEFEKKIEGIEAKAIEYHIKYKDIVTSRVDIENWANAQILRAYEDQEKKFNEMISGIEIARQKAIDEAKLAGGNMFAPPTGALMEIDVWLKKEREIYRNNSNILIGLEKEAAQKRLEIVRDWTVKRAEAEKGAIDKIKTGLEGYREALVKVYDDAIARADLYRQRAMEIGAFTEEWSKKIAGWGKPPKSQAEEIEEEKKALDALVKSAWQAMDPAIMMQAVEGIGKFIDKFGALKGFMGSPLIFPEALKSQAQDLLRHLDLIKAGAEQSVGPIENFANRQLEGIKAVDQWIKYLQGQVVVLDDQINKTKTLQIDVSTASSNLDSIILKAGQVNQLLSNNLALTSQAAIPSGIIPGIGGDSSGAVSVLETVIDGNSAAGWDGGYSYPGVTVTRGSDIAPSGDGGGAVSMPVYAAGTRYVSATGPAFVHRGEVVSNPREARQFISGDHGGGKAAVFSPVTTINNYGVDDPAALSRKLEKYLFGRFRDFNRLIGANRG